MPELPDVEIYVERLRALLCQVRLERVRLGSAFVLRTYQPALTEVEGRKLLGVERLGKRIVLSFENDLFLVIHLMIAGRLRWRAAGVALRRRFDLVAFDFNHGCLLLTEAGTKKRASLHCVRGRAALADFNRGGLEPLGSTLANFKQALLSENRTLKRALTDPRLFSGIGNAYSDEILHRAGLSPVRRTSQLQDAQIERLHQACQTVLSEWTARLRAEVGDGFPEQVTAFHEEMAVHGRFRKPCPVCGTPVQRIVYAANECNYCPACQTEGKLLADRALSRLLREDWPKSLEELEERRAGRVEK